MSMAHYEGKLDLPGFPLVEGWIWDADEPNATLTVAIFINGIFVITARCDQFRQDLSDEHKGDGCKSFSVKLPAEARPQPGSIISARVQSGEYELQNSPAHIVF